MALTHLTQRVAWHDAGWQAKVCDDPAANPYCVALRRIREERRLEVQQPLRGREWAGLATAERPPCIFESAGFMNEHPWTRLFEHPYHRQETHRHLLPTEVEVDPYSTFAVPYRWMLADQQEGLDLRLAEPLPADEPAPFDSPWVFGRERQIELLTRWSSRLTEKRSLVFFYAKGGHPFGEKASRLVVGLGSITRLDERPRLYRVDSRKPYPMWDLLFSHSIEPGGANGFLLPYREYLANSSPGDAMSAIERIAVPVPADHELEFSYGSSHARADAALAVLERCIEVIDVIRKDGLVAGPWDAREDWINAQLGEVWRGRGLYPGLGSVLEAEGMRLGTELVWHLEKIGLVTPALSAWDAVDAVMRGRERVQLEGLQKAVLQNRVVWEKLAANERRSALANLMSRFDVTPAQAARWMRAEEREPYVARFTSRAIHDRAIISNPYTLSELDHGAKDDRPITVKTIDRGLFVDKDIVTAPQEQMPSDIDPHSPDRVSAAVVEMAKERARQGDTILSFAECAVRLQDGDHSPSLDVPATWLAAQSERFARTLKVVPVELEDGQTIECLQTEHLQQCETRVRSRVEALARQPAEPLDEDWSALLVEHMRSVRPDAEPNPDALAEQSGALAHLVSRKLSVLVGGAGTGKTSVLGALAQSSVRITTMSDSVTSDVGHRLGCRSGATLV